MYTFKLSVSSQVSAGGMSIKWGSTVASYIAIIYATPIQTPLSTPQQVCAGVKLQWLKPQSLAHL